MAKKKEKTPLKKGISTFHIVGEAKITQNTFSLDNESQTSDWIYNSMQLGIDTGEGNVVYASLMAGYGAERDNVIYVHGKDSEGKDDWDNSFTIDWDDRDDETILDTVGNSCFIRVGIEKDSKGKTYTKRFLSAYDAIEYLSEHLTEGTVISVRGNLQYQYYKDNITVNKNITSIYISNAEPDKYCANFEQTILLDSDSIGKIDKERGTFPIDCYVVDYVGKIDGQEIKQNVSLAKSFELNINKDKPELTKKVLDRYFKVKKKGQIVELGVEGVFQEGATITTDSIDDLPDDLKELLELELITEEEAFAKCTDGRKERRMIITKPLARKTGEGENTTVTIVKNEDKYDENDLVFLESLLDEDSEEDIVETSTTDDDDLLFDLDNDKETDSDNDTEDDWIKELLSD